MASAVIAAALLVAALLNLDHLGLVVGLLARVFCFRALTMPHWVAGYPASRVRTTRANSVRGSRLAISPGVVLWRWPPVN